jgi:hypothetical protein
MEDNSIRERDEESKNNFSAYSSLPLLIIL